MTSYWDLYIAYVRECEKLNQANNIDPHHYEMEWNHTLPQCLFGDLPFGQFLTLKQHAIASCLQAVIFRKVCFTGRHKNLVPEWLWEEAMEASKGDRLVMCRNAGKVSHRRKLGVHSASSEQLSEWARRSNGKGGRKTKERGNGIFAPGMQALGGKTTQQLGVGVFALTKEQQRELGRRTTSQRWRCLITGHISTPGGLARFQKARGIDTSLRERVE